MFYMISFGKYFPTGFSVVPRFCSFASRLRWHKDFKFV